MPSSLRRTLSTVLAGVSLILATTTGPAHAAATVDVSADYRVNIVGGLNKDQLLNVSQGGYVTLQNLHALPDHAAALAELGVRQLRVDHVFDDEFYGVVKSDGNYDYTKLDAVLKPFLDQGIKPWISLSYMPRALRKIPAELFSPPADNAAWARAVKALVQHFGRRGWNWEVWNEPDFFWKGTSADYLSMYAATAKAVKEGDSSAQVGGPGVTKAGMLGDWLDFIAANRTVPADFVSWHDYGAPTFTSASTVRDALAARSLSGKKLYVTEWHAGSRMDNGPGTWPDTQQSASYAAHRMFEALKDTGLNGIFFFTGLEGLTPQKDFNGDLGLLTVEGRRKAVGNTFAMLQSMSAVRLGTSVTGASSTATHGLVTQDAATRKVSVLLWNDTLERTPFNVSVDNLPYTGNFAVTRFDIDGTAGTSWFDQSAGLANQRPSPNELLRPSSRDVVAATSKWSTSLTLEPNATALIELTPADGESIGAKPVAPVATTVNLARGMEVSHSTEYTARGWFPKAVTDGRRYSYANADAEGADPTMGWTSVEHTTNTPPAPEWVQVDLGSIVPFDTVTLWPRSDQAGDGHNFPADFTIAGSADGTTWDTLISRTGYSPVPGPQAFPISSDKRYRFVRVSASKLGLPIKEGGRDAYRFQLAELEVTKRATNIGVANPGFETGAMSGWTATGAATVVDSDSRSGKHAATFAGAGNGVNVTVTGLKPATTYTFSGYLRSGTPGDKVQLGVKDYGGAETSAFVDATTYTPTSVTFTTGPSSTSANLFARKNSGVGRAWFDDFALVQN
ncbi:GH39 family glycosyl hydrolase [Nonomuraea basaltis]|uniref:GH39 family glycosyl hydrolase n=1 Tax=Nonomuraea basaltis TaxID=2495887 RepID=UPI0014863C27|nr:discoidin domain-containing protein [Nonomuraea basaltis]